MISAPDLPTVPPKPMSPTATPAEDGDTEASEPSEPPTPSIKQSETRSKEYFDPSVELELAKDDTDVKAVHVVGWRIPESSFQALLWTVKGYLSAGHPSLTTLRLVSAGLTDSMVSTLSNTLRRISNITTLHIHSNPPIAPLVLSGLLATDTFVGPSPLVTLSIQFCGVTNSGASELALELRKNFNLQTLSLYGNKLTDDGGVKVARALRINRTLKVLDLGHNDIGNATIMELELALTEFPLSHDEVVARRRLLLVAAGVDDGTSDERGDSRSGKRGTMLSRKSSKSDLRKGGKGAASPPKKGAKGKAGKDKKATAAEEEKEPPSSPLIDPEPRLGDRGQLIINGSWALNCLNVGRELLAQQQNCCVDTDTFLYIGNNITVEGLESLLRIVKFQAKHCTPSAEESQGVLQGSCTNV